MCLSYLNIVRIGASLFMIEDHQTMCEIGTMERCQLHCPPSSLTLFPSLVRPFPSIVRSPTFASEPLPERPPSSPTAIPPLGLIIGRRRRLWVRLGYSPVGKVNTCEEAGSARRVGKTGAGRPVGAAGPCLFVRGCMRKDLGFLGWEADFLPRKTGRTSNHLTQTSSHRPAFTNII